MSVGSHSIVSFPLSISHPGVELGMIYFKDKWFACLKNTMLLLSTPTLKYYVNYVVHSLSVLLYKDQTFNLRFNPCSFCFLEI